MQPGDRATVQGACLWGELGRGYTPLHFLPHQRKRGNISGYMGFKVRSGFLLQLRINMDK